MSFANAGGICKTIGIISVITGFPLRYTLLFPKFIQRVEVVGLIAGEALLIEN